MKHKYFCLLSVLLIIVLLLIACRQTATQKIIPSTSAITTAPVLNSPENTGALTSTSTATQGFKFPNAGDVENRFGVQEAFSGLQFNRPLSLINAGDGSNRIFVVEQKGRINIIQTSPSVKSELFLDIGSRVNSISNEMGLLGLAFHPLFKENGLFFVNYTTSDSTIISSFNVDTNNPNVADPASEKIIMTFPQPYTNHNGGQIAFSPADNYLYIGVGDGGSEGDPQGNGQNLNTLLGKILRIDVNKKNAGINYSIPPDNPFKGNSQNYKEEIYAYGLRNPWRFSFDPLTGFLWVGDVGQNRLEEIDLVDRGKNYGWNIMEGTLCYNPPSGCNSSGLELPVYEYDHSLGDAIIGGFVYHGKELPKLQGAYIYGDYGSGTIWGLWHKEGNGPKNFTLAKTNLNISSFGIDENDQLFITAFDGKIYTIKLLQ
ncbi:MAG: PQQ-dependent sugar dehydrogenase [Candidatus Humimicrobiaceae bacterium]